MHAPRRSVSTRGGRARLVREPDVISLDKPV